MGTEKRGKEGKGIETAGKVKSIGGIKTARVFRLNVKMGTTGRRKKTSSCKGHAGG